MDTPFGQRLGVQTLQGAVHAVGDPFAQVLERLQPGRRVRTQGIQSAARGYVLARLSRSLQAPLVCVAVDEEAADALAHDLAFFLGGSGTLLEPRVLRLPADEVLPYDELSPEPTAISERLGTLFHLSQGTRFPALVLSMRALLRKVLPPPVMHELSARVTVGQDFDRDSLARKLASMGYQSSPLVEDPGTFSVRGGILDVFSPLYERPVRLEFFGDTIESIRVFDPDTQRTVDSLKEVSLVPAREVMLTEQTRPRAESAARAAADRINLPTIQLRERLDALREGMPGFGLEGLMPGFFEGGLGTVFDYLRLWAKDPLFYFDDPVGLDRAASDLWAELERTFEAAEERKDLSLPPPEHFLTRAQADAQLTSARVLEGGGLALTPTEQPPVLFSFGSTQDLREAILAHHGEEGALTPLVERLQRWREMRVACAIACGTLSQADRLKRLLLDRNVMVRIHEEAIEDVGKLYEPSIYAHLFTGEVSHGFVDGSGGIAVLADEEIFGVRARRRVRRSKKLDAFAAGFKDLKEGDLIVHTDFGIGRYAGLTKMQVQGVPGDFLVLEYAGKDKIYLPVSRMR
ncbi:MAG TPA: CarD family transcriptional regulator, partial [Hyalangium sp.]|nr:CarD family transcriptional regulator [Hyalangium sp.]